jgi:hypothetical protein
MTPEFILGVISSTVVITIVTVLLDILKSRFKHKEESSVQREQREYSDVDQVRAVVEAQNTDLKAQLLAVHTRMTEVDLHREVETQELKQEILKERQEVAECRKQHAESRLQAEVTKQENAMLRERVEANVDEIADLKTTIQLYFHKIQRLEVLVERRGLTESE